MMNKLSPDGIKSQVNQVIDKLYPPKKLAAMVVAWQKYQDKMTAKSAAMKFKYHQDPDRDKFIKRRVATIGGSDVPIILGRSSFMTRVELFMKKTMHKSTLKEDKPSECMLLGNDFESSIISAYKRITGNQVTTSVPAPHRMEKLPWLVGNIDGMVMNRQRILECKLAGAFSDKTGENWGKKPNEYALENDEIVQTIYSDLIPKPYLYQCMTYMMILGCPETDLAVFHGANKLMIYTIPFDIGITTEIIRKCTAFLFNNVMQGKTPKPSCIGDINAIYHEDDGEAMTASSELMDWRIEAMALKEDQEALKDELEGGKGGVMGKIKLFAGNSQCIVDPNGEKILSWKNQPSTSFNTTKFRNKHPRLYAKFASKGTTRVLRFHETKEEKKAAKK